LIDLWKDSRLDFCGCFGYTTQGSRNWDQSMSMPQPRTARSPRRSQAGPLWLLLVQHVQLQKLRNWGQSMPQVRIARSPRRSRSMVSLKRYAVKNQCVGDRQHRLGVHAVKMFTSRRQPLRTSTLLEVRHAFEQLENRIVFRKAWDRKVRFYRAHAYCWCVSFPVDIGQVT